MGENAVQTTVKTEKAPKKSWFKGIKSEFKKIIWPDKESLVKQTAAVIVVTVMLGLIIAFLDWVLEFGIGFIL